MIRALLQFSRRDCTHAYRDHCDHTILFCFGFVAAAFLCDDFICFAYLSSKVEKANHESHTGPNESKWDQVLTNLWHHTANIAATKWKSELHLYPAWQDVQVATARTTVSSWCNHRKGQEINSASVTSQLDICWTWITFFLLVGPLLFCKVLLGNIIGLFQGWLFIEARCYGLLWTPMDCLCSAEFQPSARCALRTSLLPRQLQKKVRRGHGIHGLGIPEMNARTAILQHGEDNEATKPN